MVMTASNMIELGTAMPEFSLEDIVSGEQIDSTQLNGPVVVIFMCNHCPFVVHLLPHMTELANAWLARGVSVVAINANDVERYPADAPQKMVDLALHYGFLFPYCFDSDQSVAKAFDAACTPDFYVFAKGRLCYRGQYDASRPSNGIAISGEDISAAVDAVLDGQTAPAQQKPSVGCNIKWR